MVDLTRGMPGASGDVPRFVLITVVSDGHVEGYQSLKRSAEYFDVPFVALGLEEEWGGFGTKLTTLKAWLAQQEPNLLVMFTDGHDTLVRVPREELLRRVRTMLPDNKTIVFASDRHPWPDPSLGERYPRPARNRESFNYEDQYRYLCSGQYVGRASALSLALQRWTDEGAKEDADDQLYYTLRYLNDDIGHGVQIHLDYDRYLFQGLQQLKEWEWQLSPALYDSDDGRGTVEGLTFTRRDGLPAAAMVHGNSGSGKELVFHLSNYEAGAWSKEEGSKWHTRDESSPYVQPLMVLAVLCKDSPFIDDFVRGLEEMKLDYKKTILFIWRDPKCRLELDKGFTARFADVIEETKDKKVTEAQSHAFQIAHKSNAMHVFLLDSTYIVQRPDVIQQLVQDNLTAVIPFAEAPDDPVMPSNFLLSVKEFVPEKDYYKLATRQRRGLWRVRCWIKSALIRSEAFRSVESAFKRCSSDKRPSDLGDEMCVCKEFRKQPYWSIILDNRHVYGEILGNGTRVDSDEAMQLHAPDFFEAAHHPTLWDRRYLAAHTKPGGAVTVVCTGVFAVDIFNQRFCDDLSSVAGGSHSTRGAKEGIREIQWHAGGFGGQWTAVWNRHVAPRLASLPHEATNTIAPREPGEVDALVRSLSEGRKGGRITEAYLRLKYLPCSKQIQHSKHSTSGWLVKHPEGRALWLCWS
ncbi:unnamed protein product [Vitrella brassicaformis CCMP3155]|uniref:PLOD1-3-like GT domain-containing protein n=2 Tax=Vitrella brassicaformis TaxID=1169539 RepID=A0A0G4H1M8_VITBC|nr:unnamed protein product [Vitrella brassicaformis CCMP3155]|eukprot:CEM37505.1 unnamed protein product [Vitrella brassicaformis CCMP3155]